MHNSDSTKIIVIGAGISGLSAAKKLQEMGEQVIVLEGNTEIGGRTRTKQVHHPTNPFAPINFDLGASWIHQSSKNHPITKIAKQANSKLVETDDDKLTVYDLNEQEQVSDKTMDQAWKSYEKLIEKIEDMGEKDLTVEEGLQKSASGKLKDPVFMFHVSTDIEFQTAAPISNLSGWQAYNDDSFDGDEMFVASGYQGIINTLAQGLDIRTGCVIVEVIQQNESVEVVCNDGRRFRGEYAVLSVPLGVLQRDLIKFSPPLPAWKQESIKKMGFGNVCKVLITFNTPLQSKDHYFGVIAKDVQNRGQARYFLNVNTLLGVPAVMTFGLGASADVVEMMPQEQLRAIIRKQASFFLTQQQLNEMQIHRSAWRQNPFSFGAYSYPRPGCTFKDYQNLAKPVGQLYFCGEHTTARYRSTAHGAYLSGEAAAKYIKDDFDDKKWVYVDAAWKKKQDSD